MFQDTYFVDKRTGTFADTFLAYGLATLLDSVLAQCVDEDHWVRLRDRGACYAVELSHGVREEWIGRVTFQGLAPYIKAARAEPQLLAGLPASMVVDYQREWERFLQSSRMPQDERHKLLPEELARLESHPHFPVFAWVGERRMQALASYSKLILLWHSVATHFGEHLRHILMLCAAPEQDVEAVAALWRARMRQLGVKVDSDRNLIQLLNPSQGKGLNEPKANRLKMDNIKSWWPIEYLKVVGMYHCAVPRVVKIGGKPSGDYKTYAIAPINMRLSTNDAVLTAFQRALWNETAVKMDVLAGLQYTRCFLDYCQAAREGDLATQLLGHGPQDFVAGMHVAYYKSLGQASAVMNLSFIELPRWMRVTSPDEVEIWRNLLAEHESIIRNIEEEKGGYELLITYRDFLSGGRWDAFFDFTAAYARYLMHELGREHYWIKPFTVHNLERLIMKSNEPLAPILETPGFRNIADAIRRSTVIPQYLGRDKSEYDIRYGLGQELKRKSLYNDEFVAALSEFVQSYNAENARVFEKTGKQYRKNVLTSDVEDVVRLVDKYGAATVGNLLLAFGYAREHTEEASGGQRMGNEV